jgi:hypothetical protein
MHAVTSDEEEEKDAEEEDKQNEIMSKKLKVSKLKNSKRNLDMKKKLQLKKRVKKIIRKLKEKALDTEGYNKASKDLYSLHKLILNDKVGLVSH